MTKLPDQSFFLTWETVRGLETMIQTLDVRWWESVKLLNKSIASKSFQGVLEKREVLKQKYCSKQKHDLFIIKRNMSRRKTVVQRRTLLSLSVLWVLLNEPRSLWFSHGFSCCFHCCCCGCCYFYPFYSAERDNNVVFVKAVTSVTTSVRRSNTLVGTVNV